MTDIEMLLESDITAMDFEENNDAVKVKGFAAHVGVMNRQTFTKEALEKAASSFIGTPITAIHSDGTNVVVGKTNFTDVRMDESVNREGLYFEGEIGSEYEEAKNIKRGYLSKVSIRIGPEKQPSHYCNICGNPIGKCSHNFSDTDFNPIVNDFYGKHIAIVTEPADRASSITMSFSDGKVEQLNLEDYIRRTRMSDFEEKYVELRDDFDAFKDEKRAEIEKLEADFKEQKTELEAQIVSETEKYMNLKNDFDAISSEKEALESELNDFKEKFAKQEEEKLTALREEVTTLNKEVYGNLTEEQINSFEESTLVQFAELYRHQKDNMPAIQANVNPTNQYSEENQENDDPIKGLLSKF